MAKRLMRLRQKNADLEEENRQLKQLLLGRAEKVEVLNERIQQMQTEIEADLESGRLTKAALEDRAAQYIQEVQQCVAWLKA
ncbi:MAG: hypothetical protein AAF738_01410 [Bacteroidota bacterium]